MSLQHQPGRDSVDERTKRKLTEIPESMMHMSERGVTSEPLPPPAYLLLSLARTLSVNDSGLPSLPSLLEFALLIPCQRASFQATNWRGMGSKPGQCNILCHFLVTSQALARADELTQAIHCNRPVAIRGAKIQIPHNSTQLAVLGWLL